jgi:prepilin-type N-terminal cleavage/methylation domain-containing protein
MSLCKKLDIGAQARSNGFTLVELLVVMTVIGVLVSLTVPAVQSAKESARRLQCGNNMKQIGMACQIHVNSEKHYPTGGWGWWWVGDPDRGYGKNQPGGWIYNILPGLELTNLRNMGKGQSQTQKKHCANMLVHTPISVMACPSRRMAMLLPKSTDGLKIANNADPNLPGDNFLTRADYAACCGSQNFNQYAIAGAIGGGPPSYDAVEKWKWPDAENPKSKEYQNGVIYVRSTTRPVDILRGASHTIMAGEKYLNPANYLTGLDNGDNESMFSGQDNDNYRTTFDEPMRDKEGRVDNLRFGSPHAIVCNFVLCDGSVHSISYEVNPIAYAIFGSRNDTTTVRESVLND